MTTTPTRTVPRWLPLASLALSLLAVGLTSYLTVVHYTHPSALACPDTGVVNCTLVTTSSWSVLAGVPVAVLGLVWALAMTALNLPWSWTHPSAWLDKLRLVGAGAGAAMVLYLVYVELFRVGAICLWCTGVHLTAIALFAVTLLARPVLVATARPGSARAAAARRPPLSG
jgi:uncharacterized membrane protein